MGVFHQLAVYIKNKLRYRGIHFHNFEIQPDGWGFPTSEEYFADTGRTLKLR